MLFIVLINVNYIVLYATWHSVLYTLYWKRYTLKKRQSCWLSRPASLIHEEHFPVSLYCIVDEHFTVQYYVQNELYNILYIVLCTVLLVVQYKLKVAGLFLLEHILPPLQCNATL